MHLVVRTSQSSLEACRTLLEGLAFQEATVHSTGVLVQLQPVRQGKAPAGAGGAGGEAAELRTVSDAGGSGDAVRKRGNFAGLFCNAMCIIPLPCC